MRADRTDRHRFAARIAPARAGSGIAALIAIVLAAGCSAAGQSTGQGPTTGGASSTGSTPTTSKATTPPPTKAAQILIPQAGGAPINPKAPIVVSTAAGKLTSVTVTNAKGLHVTGDFSADNTRWSSNEDLGYGKSYQVVAVGSAEGKTMHKTGTVKVLAPRKTAYPSVIPPPGANDVGVGQPLVVRFDQTVNKVIAQKTLKVTSSPSQPGAWYWVTPTQVDYRPPQFWAPGTKITLQITDYGVDLGNGIYGETDRTLPISIHDSWIAKPDGNTHQMGIYHNGAEVKTMPISLGKPATPTHIGTHVIQSKYKKYVMRSCSFGLCGAGSYVANEYYAERISNDGEFVHENPLSVGDQGSANVSHGCINLNEANAIWFFGHFGLGDVVDVSNSGGAVLPVSDTYGDWALPWSVWSLGNAGS
ncbi:MAG: Ig-like domain-containing protein [Mycobacteriales bacterium]|nr:MAG: hypothetical protein DLM56_07385 [Pseudonocardiales bacterium]